MVLKANTTHFSVKLHCSFVHKLLMSACFFIALLSADGLICQTPPKQTLVVILWTATSPDRWLISHTTRVWSEEHAWYMHTHTHFTDRNYIRQDFEEEKQKGCATYLMQILPCRNCMLNIAWYSFMNEPHFISIGKWEEWGMVSLVQIHA